MVTPLHILPRKVARKKLPQRWHDRGWETYKQAYAEFRQIVKIAVEMGITPGQPLHVAHNDALLWLISACPEYNEKFPHGVRYFTLWENGRDQQNTYAKYSFAAVDENGSVHAFSLALALRAKRNPFYAAVVF